MTTLHARSKAGEGIGFCFETASEFTAKAGRLRDPGGRPVTAFEFEFEFVQGEPIDAELFKAIGVKQADLEPFLDAVRTWTLDRKIRAIIAVGRLGVRFPFSEDETDELDIDLRIVGGLRDLAVQLVRDGVYGRVPEAIVDYLDYDALARDLASAYSTATVAGTSCAFSVGG